MIRFLLSLGALLLASAGVDAAVRAASPLADTTAASLHGGTPENTRSVSPNAGSIALASVANPTGLRDPAAWAGPNEATVRSDLGLESAETAGEGLDGPSGTPETAGRFPGFSISISQVPLPATLGLLGLGLTGLGMLRRGQG